MSSKYSINVYSKQGIAQIRKDSSDKAELVSQILFGEPCQTVSNIGKWTELKTLNDNYCGFVDNNQLQNENYSSFKGRKLICIKNNTFIYIKNNKIPIPFGCELYEEFIKNHSVKFNIKDFIEPKLSNKNKLNFYLKRWLGVPYLWGGKSTWGTDCSGFVQTTFKLLDITLPRDAYQQAEVGETTELSKAQLGDLAFFKNREDKIVHVGIILNSKNKANIIHASGMVRIDNLDEKGIFNVDSEEYTHELALIKRIF